MKQIKFRGKSKITGEIIYGDLSHYEGGSYIDDEAVYENSVAQFVGYDADGKEVYDGDELDNGDGLKLTAKIINSISLNGDCDDDTFNEMTKQNDWKLKEN